MIPIQSSLCQKSKKTFLGLETLTSERIPQPMWLDENQVRHCIKELSPNGGFISVCLCPFHTHLLLSPSAQSRLLLEPLPVWNSGFSPFQRLTVCWGDPRLPWNPTFQGLQRDSQLPAEVHTYLTFPSRPCLCQDSNANGRLLFT